MCELFLRLENKSSQMAESVHSGSFETQFGVLNTQSSRLLVHCCYLLHNSFFEADELCSFESHQHLLLFFETNLVVL